MEEAAQLLVPPLQSWQPVCLLPVVQVRRIEVGRAMKRLVGQRTCAAGGAKMGGGYEVEARWYNGGEEGRRLGAERGRVA